MLFGGHQTNGQILYLDVKTGKVEMIMESASSHCQYAKPLCTRIKYNVYILQDNLIFVYDVATKECSNLTNKFPNFKGNFNVDEFQTCLYSYQ